MTPAPFPPLARLRAGLARLAVVLGQLPGGARLWVTLGSGGFLMAALLANGRQVLQQTIDGQGWLWLLLGVGITLVSLLANGLAWGLGLRWLGHRPRWGPVLLLFLTSNLRKYLPGGIWHLLARLRALQGQSGEPAPTVAPLASAAAALVAVLLDPLLLAAAALALIPLGGWQAGLAPLGLLPLVLLHPRWFRPLMDRLEVRRAQQLQARGLLALDDGAQGPSPTLLPLRYPLMPLLASLVFVLLRFAGFACCVQAFDLAYALDWGGWLAGFALAWTVGLVVPAAPGGLGVFEAVLLLRLGVAVPEAPLLVLAISYRLVSSLADLLGAAAGEVDQRAWSRDVA